MKFVCLVWVDHRPGAYFAFGVYGLLFRFSNYLRQTILALAAMHDAFEDDVKGGLRKDSIR